MLTHSAGLLGLQKLESQPRRCWCDSLSIGLVWHAGGEPLRQEAIRDGVKTGESVTTHELPRVFASIQNQNTGDEESSQFFLVLPVSITELGLMFVE